MGASELTRPEAVSGQASGLSIGRFRVISGESGHLEAFHVMWFLLHREFKPRSFLEIGVYRGQVLSLVSVLHPIHGTGGEVTGISERERGQSCQSCVSP